MKLEITIHLEDAFFDAPASAGDRNDVVSAKRVTMAVEEALQAFRFATFPKTVLRANDAGAIRLRLDGGAQQIGAWKIV